MKAFGAFLVFIVFFNTVSAISDVSELFRYKEGDRYFFINDLDGNLKLVDLEQVDDVNERFEAEKDVVFRLFTRNNPQIAQILSLEDVANLTNSNFDHSKPTKMYVHGWLGNGDDLSVHTLTDGFLGAFDANVITVGWEKGSNHLYNTACTYAPHIGALMGRMIDWLVSLGSRLDNFHVLGFSLGGQIVGFAGRSVSGGRVPYITSMDPAMPLWGEGSERLRRSDAHYVEIVHTNMNRLGLADAIGHNDFYPNGGTVQAGCSALDVSCSHDKSFHYVGASMDHAKFMAQQCLSLEQITQGSCSNISQLHLGGGSPKEARGLFYLKTNADFPYYQE